MATFPAVVSLLVQTSTPTNTLHEAVSLKNTFFSMYIVKENQNRFTLT